MPEGDQVRGMGVRQEEDPAEGGEGGLIMSVGLTRIYLLHLDGREETLEHSAHQA